MIYGLFPEPLQKGKGKDKYYLDMNTKTLTKNDLTNEIKRDRTSIEYLEVTGIGKNNIRNLIPRGTQQEVESFIETKKVTVWIRKQ